MQDKAPLGQVLCWPSLRILILDRNEEFRVWMRSVLEGMGAEEIHSMASSTDAIQLLRQKAVDVGLVAIAADDGSGLQFLAELRQRPSSPSPNLPVILLTEAGDDKLIHEACGIGVQNLLRKLVSEEELLKRVTRTVLRPKRVIWASTYFGFDRRNKPSFGYLGPQRRSGDNIGEEVPLVMEYPGAPPQEWDLSRSEDFAQGASVPPIEPDPEPKIAAPVEPEPPAPEPEPEPQPEPEIAAPVEPEPPAPEPEPQPEPEIAAVEPEPPPPPAPKVPEPPSVVVTPAPPEPVVEPPQPPPEVAAKPAPEKPRRSNKDWLDAIATKAKVAKAAQPDVDLPSVLTST